MGKFFRIHQYFKKKQSGQIVVEYVLLVIISVSLAALVTSMVVSRDPENPGFLIGKWIEILQAIGQDLPSTP